MAKGLLAGFVRWLGGGLALGSLCLAGTALWMAALPDPAPLARQAPRTTAFVERARAAGQAVDWQWVPFDRISDELKLAVVVAEDINFFDHNGFDIFEVRQAVKDSLNGKRLRGASTISQQVVKNLWLSPERSLRRKVEEAALTWKLERTLPKRRILELYLNIAQFGPGVFGAEAASRRYFRIPAARLDREQAARLAAGLPAPSRWHPGCTSPTYARHVDRILRRMNRASWLRPNLGSSR